MLTRHPKLVLTALAVKPRLENSLENDVVSWRRGRSSAIAHNVRRFDRLTPRVRRVAKRVGLITFVHSSMTP